MMRLGGSDVDPFEYIGSGTSVLLPVKCETNTVSPPKVGPANSYCGRTPVLSSWYGHVMSWRFSLILRSGGQVLWGVCWSPSYWTVGCQRCSCVVQWCACKVQSPPSPCPVTWCVHTLWYKHFCLSPQSIHGHIHYTQSYTSLLIVGTALYSPQLEGCLNEN